MKPSTASKRCLTKALQYGIIERIPSTWWRTQSIGCLVAATFDTSMQRNERESKSLTTRITKAMTYSESPSIMMSDYAYLLYLIPLFIKISQISPSTFLFFTTSHDLCLLIRASKARLIVKHVLIEANVSTSKVIGKRMIASCQTFSNKLYDLIRCYDDGCVVNSCKTCIYVLVSDS